MYAALLSNIPNLLQAVMMPGEVAAKRAAEREQWRSIIQQWNSDRLDLFELSEPNEVCKVPFLLSESWLDHVKVDQMQGDAEPERGLPGLHGLLSKRKKESNSGNKTMSHCVVA